MEITLEEQIKSKTSNTKHDIASTKQKFESDDSEGSDFSYQSSLTDEDDTNVGRIEFFKEEMARFFINYPELINKNIIQDNSDKESTYQHDNRDQLSKQMNRNWQSIAEQIFNQAKESSTSLQSLAKRISLYRYKIDQTDLIDLLLQQKDTILKEIEAEIQNKKNDSIQMERTEKMENHLEKKMKEGNTYLSWRKRKECELKLQNNRNTKQRSGSASLHKAAENSLPKEKSKPVQKFHKSLYKSASISSQAFGKTNSTKIQINRMQSRSKEKQERQDKENIKHLDDTQLIPECGSRLAANWRHLINFQPKTEVAKQLSEQIKKKNQPSDQLGIKKTIIEYLHNYKTLINNDVISKSTLSQKIQKLYTEQAKELLMFYPSKLSTYDSQSANSCSNLKEGGQDNFMNLLKKISNGPLIKYWKQIQQNKV